MLIASLALAQRKKSGADRGDIQALADVEQRLFTELRRLEKMDAEATKISTSAGKIREEVHKATAALDRMVTHAKSTLRALNIELHDETSGVRRPDPRARVSPVRASAGQ